jgi:hypothetical protein
MLTVFGAKLFSRGSHSWFKQEDFRSAFNESGSATPRCLAAPACDIQHVRCDVRQSGCISAPLSPKNYTLRSLCEISEITRGAGAHVDTTRR